VVAEGHVQFTYRGYKVTCDRASINRQTNIATLESNVVLDTGAPVGDAMVRIPGLKTPVSPGSTVGGCMLVNCIKAEVAARLVKAGLAPKVLSAAAVVGHRQATELFESAYDEHARRLSRLYQDCGDKAHS